MNRTGRCDVEMAFRARKTLQLLPLSNRLPQKRKLTDGKVWKDNKGKGIVIIFDTILSGLLSVVKVYDHVQKVD